MNKAKNTISTIIFEFAKWGLVVYLLWPLLSFQAQRMPLWRMVIGIMLLVISLGKIFYDIFLDNYNQKKEQYELRDLLLFIFGVTIVAVIIGGVIMLIGLYVAQQAGSGLGE